MGVMNADFQEGGTKLREKKNSNNRERGRARERPSIFIEWEEKPSGVRVCEGFNCDRCLMTADGGNRILEMEQGGGEGEGGEKGGRTRLSSVKEEAKDRLKREALASGSVIKSPH